MASRLRRVRRVRVLMLAVVLLPGCDECQRSRSTSAPDASTPIIPKVDSVRVRPSIIHATAGSRFTLTAVAKGRWGRPVTVPDGARLTVLWTASATGVVENPTANPVTLVVPSQPGTTFTLQATVKRSDGAPGGPSPPVPSNTVTVHVTPVHDLTDGTAETSDWIRVEHVPGNPPAGLLVQATEGGVEVADWSVGVVGSARLGRNLEPLPPPESGNSADLEGSPPDAPVGELAIFAQDRYMELWPPGGPVACAAGAASCPWTTGPDDLKKDPLDFNDFRVLSVRAGVADLDAVIAGIPAEDWAKRDATRAFNLLNRLRAGLEHGWIGAFEHELDGGVKDPSEACPRLNGFLSGYSAETDADLFILYVPEILAPTNAEQTAWKTLAGWACEPGEWVGRIVLVATNNYNVTTLVHEIGHVLSLASPWVEGANGHPGPPGTFDVGNIMDNTDGLHYREARNHLTLGQLYRMNAHPASWLNTLPNPAPRLLRSCDPKMTRGVCPALDADFRD